MMSGCPGAPGDSHANWITTEWPPEVREILRWQWDDVLIPYWRDLVAYAREQGVDRLCLELHGHQNVYNVATLHAVARCRRAKPSAPISIPAISCGWAPIRWRPPLRWATPSTTCTRRTRASIPRIAGINGVIDTTPGSDFKARAWSYITLGLRPRRRLVARVRRGARRRVGYDGVLSHRARGSGA